MPMLEFELGYSIEEHGSKWSDKRVLQAQLNLSLALPEFAYPSTPTYSAFQALKTRLFL
jgi:hypothetical protein